MKKKLLSLFLAISCLFALNITTNATVASNSKDEQGTFTLFGPHDFKSGLYASANFGSVKAYCIDPGKNPVKDGTDCPAMVLGNDEDFTKAAKYIFNSKADQNVKGTAIRVVAVATGAGSLDGYTGKTDDSKNARCGYIAAAYKAASKAKYTVKSAGLSGYTSSGGTKCTEWGVTGDSVINLAAEALSATKKAANAGSAAPTAKVTTSGGTAKVIIDNSKGTKPVTVNIVCDSNTTGDCVSNESVKEGTTRTFTLKSKVNDSKQCGTFTATMTYDGGSETGCTEITKYSCGALQDYAGCSKEGGAGTPGGSGKVTETIKDPNTGSSTINIKCDDKKKECPYTEDQVQVIADGEGLCDSTGKEVIKVGEATLFTQDVEDCIIDNEKFLVASSNNGVCRTYCVEDYSFESDSLMLSGKDKDPVTGRVTITAGSYFNFATENPKATEKGVVKCYTKLDLNTFKAKVEETAQKSYADHLKDEKHSCSCTDNGDGTKTCTDLVTITTYTAHYTGNKVEFTPNVTGPTPTTVSSCDGIKDIPANADSYKATYEGQVNALIAELEQCAKTAAEGKYYDSECNSKVVFDYGYNMDPINLEPQNKQATDEVIYRSNCNGDYSKCSGVNKTVPTANLDLGTGKSVTYPTLEYVEKITNISAEYILKGVGICNNYTNGTSSYLGDGKTTKDITEEECTKTDGATWVQGWPIKYDTPQGQYSYEIKVSDFGHIKGAEKCKTLDHYLKGKTVSISCGYTVNGCEECKWGCPPEANCDGNPCDEECIWQCVGVGCIYDSGNGLALNYQPISMLNVDQSFAYLSDKYAGVAALSAAKSAPVATQTAATATHREVASVNWNTEKGKATLDVIENQGEEIYEGKPEYKVTLTPKTLKEIKKYNKEQDSGFLNKSLECTVADKSMEYVTCTSKYLKQLKEDGILEVNDASFKSIKDIPSYVSGYTIVSDRKSGTGPAWK